MRILIFLSLIISSIQAYSQENQLDFYGDVMINALQADHRSFAAEKFNDLILERLEKSNSFDDSFIDIEWMSKLYPSDSTFRIISYQIEKENDEFEAFGFIQRSNGSVIKLVSGNKDFDSDVPFMQLDQNNWYGVLYYNILETIISGETKYLLFGYDGHSKYDRRKIVDVLTFVNDKEVLFGAEIFVKEVEGKRPELSQRLLIEYSSDSNVTLNYKEGLEMIVHDHLIARIGSMPGQGATYLSDGSLVGYKFVENQWVYVPRIYDMISTEAPRPQPVFKDGGSSKNIMGKDPKKKKKRKK